MAIFSLFPRVTPFSIQPAEHSSALMQKKTKLLPTLQKIEKAKKNLDASKSLVSLQKIEKATRTLIDIQEMKAIGQTLSTLEEIQKTSNLTSIQKKAVSQGLQLLTSIEKSTKTLASTPQIKSIQDGLVALFKIEKRTRIFSCQKNKAINDGLTALQKIEEATGSLASAPQIESINEDLLAFQEIESILKTLGTSEQLEIIGAGLKAIQDIEHTIEILSIALSPLKENHPIQKTAKYANKQLSKAPKSLDVPINQKIAFGISMASLGCNALAFGGFAAPLGILGLTFQVVSSFSLIQSSFTEPYTQTALSIAQLGLSFTPLKPMVQAVSTYSMCYDSYKQAKIALDERDGTNNWTVGRNLFIYATNTFHSCYNLHKSLETVSSKFTCDESFVNSVIEENPHLATEYPKADPITSQFQFQHPPHKTKLPQPPTEDLSSPVSKTISCSTSYANTWDCTIDKERTEKDFFEITTKLMSSSDNERTYLCTSIPSSPKPPNCVDITRMISKSPSLPPHGSSTQLAELNRQYWAELIQELQLPPEKLKLSQTSTSEPLFSSSVVPLVFSTSIITDESSLSDNLQDSINAAAGILRFPLEMKTLATSLQLQTLLDAVEGIKTTSVKSASLATSQQLEALVKAVESIKIASTKSMSLATSQQLEALVTAVEGIKTAATKSVSLATSLQLEALVQAVESIKIASTKSMSLATSQQIQDLVKAVEGIETASVKSTSLATSQQLEALLKAVENIKTASVKSTSLATSQQLEALVQAVENIKTASVKSESLATSQQLEALLKAVENIKTASVKSESLATSQQLEALVKAVEGIKTTSVKSASLATSQQLEALVKAVEGIKTTSVKSASLATSQQLEALLKAVENIKTASVKSTSLATSQQLEALAKAVESSNVARYESPVDGMAALFLTHKDYDSIRTRLLSPATNAISNWKNKIAITQKSIRSDVESLMSGTDYGWEPLAQSIYTKMKGRLEEVKKHPDHQDSAYQQSEWSREDIKNIIQSIYIDSMLIELKKEPTFYKKTPSDVEIIKSEYERKKFSLIEKVWDLIKNKDKPKTSEISGIQPLTSANQATQAMTKHLLKLNKMAGSICAPALELIDKSKKGYHVTEDDAKRALSSLIYGGGLFGGKEAITKSIHRALLLINAQEEYKDFEWSEEDVAIIIREIYLNPILQLLDKSSEELALNKQVLNVIRDEYKRTTSILREGVWSLLK